MSGIIIPEGEIQYWWGRYIGGKLEGEADIFKVKTMNDRLYYYGYGNIGYWPLSLNDIELIQQLDIPPSAKKQPKDICLNFERIQVCFPEICMNCVKRNGYPTSRKVAGNWCDNYLPPHSITDSEGEPVAAIMDRWSNLGESTLTESNGLNIVNSEEVDDEDEEEYMPDAFEIETLLFYVDDRYKIIFEVDDTGVDMDPNAIHILKENIAWFYNIDWDSDGKILDKHIIFVNKYFNVDGITDAELQRLWAEVIRGEPIPSEETDKLDEHVVWEQQHTNAQADDNITCPKCGKDEYIQQLPDGSQKCFHCDHIFKREQGVLE